MVLTQAPRASLITRSGPQTGLRGRLPLPSLAGLTVLGASDLYKVPYVSSRMPMSPNIAAAAVR